MFLGVGNWMFDCSVFPQNFAASDSGFRRLQSGGSAAAAGVCDCKKGAKIGVVDA